MASENETVEDICKYYKSVWHGLDDVKLENYEGKDVLGIVDRFESAWRREKAQVMKSATEVAMAPTQVQYEPRPKRNIDVYSCYEEAWVAFNSMCDRHLNCGTECPLHRGDDNTYGAFECFGRWLFAPVAEGGEK